jgi:hypothetical protein
MPTLIVLNSVAGFITTRSSMKTIAKDMRTSRNAVCEGMSCFSSSGHELGSKIAGVKVIIVK